MTQVILYQPGNSAVHRMHLDALSRCINGSAQIAMTQGIRATLDIIRARAGDVLFVQATGVANILVVPIARIRGVKIFYYLHEPSSFHEKLENGNPLIKSIAWHIVQKMDVMFSNYIIVSREQLKDSVVEIYGARRDRVCLAPLIMTGEDLRAQERPRITYIGRIDERRYFSEFLRNASRMRDLGLVPTVITGDIDRLKSYNIPDEIDLLAVPRFSESLKAKILSETRAIWNPKSIPISQSGVTVEALRYGCYVILTNNDPAYDGLISAGIGISYDEAAAGRFEILESLDTADIQDACATEFSSEHGVMAFDRYYAPILGLDSSRGGRGELPAKMPKPETERPKILYIGGWGRSGSTILGNILGARENSVFVGETRYLWDRGLLENKRCGCKARLNQCEFWTSVVDRTDPGGGDTSFRIYWLCRFWSILSAIVCSKK